MIINIYEYGQDESRIVSKISNKNQKAIAMAKYSEKMNETGWNYLTVETNSDYPDKIQVISLPKFLRK